MLFTFKKKNPIQDKLLLMKVKTEERNKGMHEDFLSRYENNDSQHIKETEHHGAQFWKYFYAGERPRAVLYRDPIAKHVFGTTQDHDAVKDHMLSAEYAEDIKDSESASNKKWLDEMYLASIAFARQDPLEASKHLQMALDETNKWLIPDERKYKTLVLYAAAMSALGKFEQAENLHHQASEVLSQCKQLRLNGVY